LDQLDHIFPSVEIDMMINHSQLLILFHALACTDEMGKLLHDFSRKLTMFTIIVGRLSTNALS